MFTQEENRQIWSYLHQQDAKIMQIVTVDDSRFMIGNIQPGKILLCVMELKDDELPRNVWVTQL